MLGLGLPALAAWQALKGWSPTTLFAAGEAGGLWDFSTLANLYQDSAGTTPCTAVGDPIGLVLDTKNGVPQLGPELVVNGDFSNGTTGWTLAAYTTAGTPAGGKVRFSGTAPNTNFNIIAYQVLSVVAGRAYRIDVPQTIVAGNVAVGFYASGVSGLNIGGSNGATPCIVVATSATLCITLYAWNGASTNVPFDVTFGPVTAKEIPGNHLTQSTSTKCPTLGRMPATGVRNLLVNTATLSTQNVNTSAGSYTIQFTGAGSVTASGTYSGALTNGQTFTCTAGTLTLTVSGSVTNAQLEAGSTATAKQVVGAAYDVTESGVASVYTAYFDGVDDCLVSPSIDFTATDAMSVFSGFRKTSDAARGMVAELSATTDSNNGSFALTAPNAASATIVYESKGTSLTDTSATIAAPADSVISAVSDISADSNVLRRNGAQTDSDTGDQGTGNFGNYPIYVGQRGAASLPYKGFLSALCTRGAATDAATVTSMEKWMAARTPGVTLP